MATYHEAEQSYYNQCAEDDRRPQYEGLIVDPESEEPQPEPPQAWLDRIALGAPDDEDIPF